jgi:hypothetical protein
LQDLGKLGEAEPLFREALEGSRRTLGDAHPQTLVSINNMAHLLLVRGELAEAEPLYREALEGLRRAHGDAHPHTLAALRHLLALRKARAAQAAPRA